MAACRTATARKAAARITAAISRGTSRNPSSPRRSSFTEGASVFGGLANMTQALTNIFTIYNPKIVAVHTTCLSEVIGDDIPMMIKKAKEEKIIPEGKYVIHANTPSFVGSHVTGFASMVTGMVKYLAESSGKTEAQIEGRRTIEHHSWLH